MNETPPDSSHLPVIMCETLKLNLSAVIPAKTGGDTADACHRLPDLGNYRNGVHAAGENDREMGLSQIKDINIGLKRPSSMAHPSILSIDAI